MIISRTPFRISFFGGGTDYPAWFKGHGGKVLTSTINRYCYITVRYLPSFFDQRHRVVWSKIETVNAVEEIQHPVVRASLEFMNIQRGVEIHHQGDLPARSGLGSSSAFTVGLLHSLAALTEKRTSKKHLADDAIFIEQQLLAEAVGIQDQIQVAHGGLNVINISRDGAYRVSPVTISSPRIQELESHLMLFFTGISRFASDIARAQIKVIPDKAREFSQLHAMVDRGVDILSGQEPINNFGHLLSEAWAIKRGLADTISNARIDSLYELAMSAGATGGKLLGAGGGGFMLLFAPPERQAGIREALSAYLEVPFRFESMGTQIIFNDQDLVD